MLQKVPYSQYTVSLSVPNLVAGLPHKYGPKTWCHCRHVRQAAYRSLGSMYGATIAHNRRYTAVSYGGGGALAARDLLAAMLLLIAAAFLDYTIASSVRGYMKRAPKSLD
jgi:hypothetical protein